MSGVFGNPGTQNGDAAGGEDEFRPFIRRLPEFKVSNSSPVPRREGGR